MSMSEAGSERGFMAPPTSETPPPLSKTTASRFLWLLVDLEESARGRRSSSTLLLRESILAWETGRYRRKRKINDRSGEIRGWREHRKEAGRRLRSEDKAGCDLSSQAGTKASWRQT